MPDIEDPHWHPDGSAMIRDAEIEGLRTEIAELRRERDEWQDRVLRAEQAIARSPSGAWVEGVKAALKGWK